MERLGAYRKRSKATCFGLLSSRMTLWLNP